MIADRSLEFFNNLIFNAEKYKIKQIKKQILKMKIKRFFTGKDCKDLGHTNIDIKSHIHDKFPATITEVYCYFCGEKGKRITEW